jgi:hypothetical protein
LLGIAGEKTAAVEPAGEEAAASKIETTVSCQDIATAGAGWNPSNNGSKPTEAHASSIAAATAPQDPACQSHGLASRDSGNEQNASNGAGTSTSLVEAQTLDGAEAEAKEHQAPSQPVMVHARAPPCQIASSMAGLQDLIAGSPADVALSGNSQSKPSPPKPSHDRPPDEQPASRSTAAGAAPAVTEITPFEQGLNHEFLVPQGLSQRAFLCTGDHGSSHAASQCQSSTTTAGPTTMALINTALCSSRGNSRTELSFADPIAAVTMVAEALSPAAVRPGGWATHEQGSSSSRPLGAATSGVGPSPAAQLRLLQPHAGIRDGTQGGSASVPGAPRSGPLPMLSLMAAAAPLVANGAQGALRGRQLPHHVPPGWSTRLRGPSSGQLRGPAQQAATAGTCVAGCQTPGWTTRLRMPASCQLGKVQLAQTAAHTTTMNGVASAEATLHAEQPAPRSSGLDSFVSTGSRGSVPESTTQASGPLTSLASCGPSRFPLSQPLQREQLRRRSTLSLAQLQEKYSSNGNAVTGDGILEVAFEYSNPPPPYGRSVPSQRISCVGRL